MTAIGPALRPRWAMAPAVLVVGLAWGGAVLGVGVPGCHAGFACPDAVLRHAAVAVGLGGPATYLVAAVATAVIASTDDDARRRLTSFAPTRRSRAALVGIATVGMGLLLAAGYGLLPAREAVWLTYVVHFPLVAGAAVVEAHAIALGLQWWLAPLVGLVYLLAALCQVGWWYALGTGLSRGWAVLA